MCVCTVEAETEPGHTTTSFPTPPKKRNKMLQGNFTPSSFGCVYIVKVIAVVAVVTASAARFV